MTQAHSKIAKVGLALSVAATMVGAPMAAHAQSGVFNCPAPGNKQAGGAVIGAILGGLLGSQVAKNEQTAGALIGAGAGAAAGSYLGCKSQTKDAYGQAYGQPGYGQPYEAGYDRGAYTRGGQRLASYVQPARFERTNIRMAAVTSVSLRAGPSTSTQRVGSLQRGESFQASAFANGGQWVLVSRNGVGVGYVHSGYVRPVDSGYRTAARW